MSNYVVSARKYRPKKFSEVVGQAHVTDTLKNALKHNQLAQALLFCGPRGVGKTTCARILAQVINCDKPTADFDACQSNNTESLNENISSFSIFELDAASNNSVEDIRNLIEQVRFAPPEGKKKVYIIDEVHMLSSAAFNAFLKTLEEPPPYAIFILATTEKHKILPTILSRCQIYDFSRIPVDAIAEHLQEIATKEQIEVDADALHLISQKADGALRDALSMFDRLVSFGGGHISYASTLNNLNILDYDYYFKIVDSFLLEDMASVLNQYQAIQQKGFEGDLFINGLAEHLRNLLVARDEATYQLLEVSDNLKKQYVNQAKIVAPEFLVNALNICNKTDINYKAAKNKRLHIEMALIKLNYLNSVVDLKSSGASGTPNETVKKKQRTPKPSNTEIKPATQQETAVETPPIVEKKEVSPTLNQKNIIEKTEPSAEKQADLSKNEESKNEVEILEDTEIKNAEQIPSFKLQNAQSNAIILPSLADLEKQVALEDAKKHDQQSNKINGNSEVVNINLKPEEVQQHLAAYAIFLRDQSKNVLGSLIANIQFSLKNQVVQMLVDSKVKAQQLRGVKEDLLKYLRKQFDEEAIELKIGFIEKQESIQPAVAYSPKEKLQEMMQKNPAIKDLIEKLDLHFEY